MSTDGVVHYRVKLTSEGGEGIDEWFVRIGLGT